MEFLLVLSIGIAAASAVGVAIVACRFAFRSISEKSESSAGWKVIKVRQGSEPVLDWIFDFSPEGYLPMLRLLDDEDFRFLRLQPGFTPQMAARVRAQRYRCFLAYLDRLRADFIRIAAAIRYTLAHADCDRPTLSAALVRAHATFAWGFSVAHIRAYLWNLGCGRMNNAPLLDLFKGLRDELSLLMPKPAPEPWMALDDV